ncbi:MAG TPA: acetyltransferase [Telluria sp.]
MLEIRGSETADVAVLVDIWRRSVLATHDFLAPADFRAIEQLVAEAYLPQAQVWVAQDVELGPVGFMGLTGNNVDSLFIDPEVRGKGIGKLLLAHAQSICGPLTVDVNEQNGQAVGFYRRMGFEQTGRSELDGDGRPYPLLHMAMPA